MGQPRTDSQGDVATGEAFVLGERQFMKACEELGRKRRKLRRTRVEKIYVSNSSKGPKSFADLFVGLQPLRKRVISAMFCPKRLP